MPQQAQRNVDIEKTHVYCFVPNGATTPKDRVFYISVVNNISFGPIQEKLDFFKCASIAHIYCMYVHLLCQILEQSETRAMLENSKNTETKKMVVNKQQSKPCNASQVNQTTDRDDKTHGAIALQLVRAPSLG